MADWGATYEDAVVAPAGDGWSVAKCGPWSQGPVLAQQLRLLRRRCDLSYVDGVATADTVHAAAEAAKLAFADREAWYGDSATVPIAELLSDDYTDERRALIGATADAGAATGSPGGRAPRIGEYAATPGAGRGDRRRRARDGRADGEQARCGPWRHGAHRRRRRGREHDLGDAVRGLAAVVADDPGARLLPRHPRPDVLAGGGAAELARAGPSAAHDAQPVAGAAHGEPRIAFGTPGGDQQDQWQLCFLLAHTRAGLDLQAAIDAPTWHSTAFPASFAPRGWEPRRAGRGVPAGCGRRWPSCAAAGTSSTTRGRGRWGGCARSGAGVGLLLRAAVDPRSGVGAAIAL